MSQMTIDCPSCCSPLLVPEEAAGRKARCTKCNTRFVIPSVQEMLEQTVTHMVLEELDHRYHESALEQAEAAAAKTRPLRPEHPVSSTGTVLGMLAISQDSTSNPGGVDNLDDMSHPVKARPRPDRSEQPAARPESNLRDTSSSDPTAATDPAPASPNPAAKSSDFPAEVRPTEPRPYLVVQEVTMKGVRLAFAAEWLNHETFRTSMPIRCAFTGSKNNDRLVSRPVVFHNRLKDGERPARALEMQYEQGLSPKHSPREHARLIGRMADLTRPFDLPLLYYADTNHGSDALTATVRTDLNGLEHCEILIPHGEVAVEWVSRVNGRCGTEYALLRSAVTSQLNDAWASLEEQTRKRLESWCHFEQGEVFKLYLKDADLTTADAGLGGVVVTDRRLLHHKFRHSRSLSLNQKAVLHLRTDDRYARLTLESQGRLARAGKINRSDMDRLIQALADAPKLRIAVGRQADAAT